jgi:hypothetical protein
MPWIAGAAVLGGSALSAIWPHRRAHKHKLMRPVKRQQMQKADVRRAERTASPISASWVFCFV